MSENLFKPVILSQLEDALEERQSSDRRKEVLDELPNHVEEDRRKGDRRQMAEA